MPESPSVTRVVCLSLHPTDGAINRTVLPMLDALREVADRLVVVSVGPLDPAVRAELVTSADRVEEPPDGARLFAAVAEESAGGSVEVLLVDDSCVGPFGSFADVFTRMADTELDAWSLTSRLDPHGGEHLDAYWILLRPSALATPTVREFLERSNRPSSEDPGAPGQPDRRAGPEDHPGQLVDAIHHSPLRRAAAWPQRDYHTTEPALESADLLLDDGAPVVPLDAFGRLPMALEERAVIGRRLLEAVERTNYPMEHLWATLARTAEPRHVHTDLGLVEILSGEEADAPSPAPRVAVLAHVFYVDLVPEMMLSVSNIPVPYALHVTTDTAEKRTTILDLLAGHDFDHVDVRIVESNRGRDLAALLITQRDLLLGGDYDLICRVHSKKSPQDSPNVGRLFREHLYDNLLGSRGYVARLLRLFTEHPTLGMVFPPVIHIGYPTLGHAWFANREPAQELAERLGIGTRFDAHTPLAAYGSMFWARPEALRAIAQAPWRHEDFPADGEYRDGSLTHVIERLLAYAAIDAGYHVRSAMDTTWAAINYAFLEYKLAAIGAFLPGTTRDQVAWLSTVGPPQPVLAVIKQRAGARVPGLAKRLRPIYREARRAYRRARS